MQSYIDDFEAFLAYAKRNGLGNEEGVFTRILKDLRSLAHVNPEHVAGLNLIAALPPDPVPVEESAKPVENQWTGQIETPPIPLPPPAEPQEIHTDLPAIKPAEPKEKTPEEIEAEKYAEFKAQRAAKPPQHALPDYSKF